MKVRVTKKGLYGAQGEIAVGTTVDLKEEPKGWAGKYVVVDDTTSDAEKDGKQAVTNPAKKDDDKKAVTNPAKKDDKE